MVQDKINILKCIKPLNFGTNNIFELSLQLICKHEEFQKKLDILKIQISYYHTIRELKKVREVEELILELENIFKIWTGNLTKELKNYWNDTKDFTDSDLYIHADTLKILIIYLIFHSNHQKYWLVFY